MKIHMSTLKQPIAQTGEDKKKKWTMGTPLAFNGRKFQATESNALLFFKHLGEGNMGRVDLFFMPLPGKKPLRVAIKSYPELDDADATKILLSHQQVLSLDKAHQNLVRIIDLDFHANLIMMEALDANWKNLGTMLSERHHNPSMPHLSGVRAMLSQVAKGLEYLHTNGLVHRDVRPSNIMVFKSDHKKPEEDVEPCARTRLIDFDQVIDEKDLQNKTNIVSGSQLYVAPEIINRSMIADTSSDIYSLGIVAYELLLPWGIFSDHLMREPSTLLAEKVRGDIRPPANMADLVPGMGPNLIKLFEAMLALNPNDRPTMGQIISTLMHG